MPWLTGQSIHSDWYAFYDLQPGNVTGHILIAPKPTRASPGNWKSLHMLVNSNILLGRPTYLSADLGFAAILLSFFSSYFFVTYLRARRTEHKQNQLHAWK